MDEIKNTTESADQKVNAAEVNENANATHCEVEAPAVETDAQASTEKENAYVEPQSKLEVIEQLKDIVYKGGNVERARLDHLKMIYYRFHNADVVAARDRFVADGGNADEFIPDPDTDEENFKAQLSLIRELRNKAAEKLENLKQQNLARKQEIIERIKALAETPDEADKGYDEVKKLQAEWKELKAVPAEKSTELWKNYQLYVEKFYDQLRLNHEMRAYDFKKNLEIKTHLCETAEKLAQNEDVISAFHQLQKLHQDFRETGPVAKELRESIWKRFKDASTIINKRHQEHFENLKANEKQNLQKKTELCQTVEALNFDTLKTYAQWDETTKQVLALQAEWKNIGFTPRKVNNDIFERFRVACDRFFQAKTVYFKIQREKINANLAAKNALIEKAEALKDSKDWAATTKKFIELQKEWKTLGPVAYKFSDSVWKRFNDACNHFFNQKNEANADQRKEEQNNLEIKKEIINELQQLTKNTDDNLLQSVRDLQTRWNNTGYVPFNKKDKIIRQYNELCDKIYNTVHENAGRRRMDNFRRNVAEKNGNELSRERIRLQNIFDNMKQEIKNYETNLSFFNSNSKKGNSLVADIEKKIERLKGELEEISAKLKTVNEKIKAENNK